MRFIPTFVHGMLDYLTAGVLFALPRRLGLSPGITMLMTGLAAKGLISSLLTRYELGLMRQMPMKTHLNLDLIGGMGLAAISTMLRHETELNRRILLGFGLWEVIASLMSKTRSPEEGPEITREYAQQAVSGELAGWR